MNLPRIIATGIAVVPLIILLALTAFRPGVPEDLKGAYQYKDFESAKKCRTCHPAFYEQWSQSMMSQAYTHHWDEIEYFDLAVAHAAKVPEIRDVIDGCNGCHTPMGFMNGVMPPARPSEGTMANESVSCEVCHLIQGTTSDPPHNFSYIIQPGQTKYSGRENFVESPAHKIVSTPFYKTTEFCGVCHNEKNPFGVWVKSTQIEWKEGPYAAEGVRCHDCHMPKSPFTVSLTVYSWMESVRFSGKVHVKGLDRLLW